MSHLYRHHLPSTSYNNTIYESSDYTNNNARQSSGSTGRTDVKMMQKMNNVTPNSNCSEFTTEQIYKPLGRKRFLRKELSKTQIGKLREILEELEARVDVANSDLVLLLVKRDQLYLERDALQLEIEDILEFHKSKNVVLNVNSHGVKGKCK